MIVGIPYSQTVTATGGTAPYGYALVSGALPPGLALNPATGVISGTPIAAGAYSFSIRATDANGCLAVIAYAVTSAIVDTHAPIHTLSEWGMVLLVLLTMALAVRHFRRR